MTVSAVSVIFGTLFVAGAILLALGTILLRPRPEFGAPTWTQLAGVPADEQLDVAQRLEIVERLAFVGDAWCIDVLHAAARAERDAKVRTAAGSALRRLETP
ncbi:MAG TPA: hypothetical protein VNG31_03575 [Candidatus Baltobacteraceae bacterium]|nr:hypothetical protein [Candidatus Baltobacteraceae bacterium]